MKMLLSLMVFVSASLAMANDGSTPYINVQGVQPNGNVWEDQGEFKSVKVYGKEVKNLFEALPYDYVEIELSRSINFYSGNYGLSVWCTKDYERPTNFEQRSDYMCTFSVFRSNGGPSVEEWEGDSYNVAQDNSLQSPLVDKNVDALGIFPENIAAGEVFSFYGKQTQYVAQNLVGSGITIKSSSYTFSWKCQKDYVRPTTGEKMNDYMCKLSLVKN